MMLRVDKVDYTIVKRDGEFTLAKITVLPPDSYCVIQQKY